MQYLKSGGECHWYDFAGKDELPNCLRSKEFIENKVNDSNQDNINKDFSKTVFEKFTDKIKNFLENAE